MKVLLVDDHPLILSALQTVIEGLRDDVVVIAADSAAAAASALERHPDLDLVLLDLALGDADGFDLLAGLRRSHPALPVVVVSATERDSDVIRAIDMGAMGFIPKRAPNRELVDALALVIGGGVYIPRVVPPAPRTPAPLGAAAPIAAHARAGAAQLPRDIASIGLTPRQSQVLSLLLQGLPNKLIARELKLSVETVKDHVAAVLHALGVTSRTQAVLAVGQMGGGYAPRPPLR